MQGDLTVQGNLTVLGNGGSGPSSGVSSIVAGTGVSISPATGLGAVTINSTGIFSMPISGTDATFTGAVTGASGAFSGALSGGAVSGATGAFTGAVSGATGAFTGNVTVTSPTATKSLLTADALTVNGVLTGLGAVSGLSLYSQHDVGGLTGTFTGAVSMTALSCTSIAATQAITAPLITASVTTDAIDITGKSRYDIGTQTITPTAYGTSPTSSLTIDAGDASAGSFRLAIVNTAGSYIVTLNSSHLKVATSVLLVTGGGGSDNAPSATGPDTFIGTDHTTVPSDGTAVLLFNHPTANESNPIYNWLIV